MKKTIILGAAAFALGVQMTQTVTAKADDLSAEQTTAKDETPANVDAEADSKAPEQEVAGDTVNEDLDGSKQEVATDVKEDEQLTDLGATEETQTDTQLTEDGDSTKEDNVVKTPVVETDENGIRTIHPKTSNMPNSVNPADEGPLLIPYPVHSNDVVYVLDPETNEPIEDANDHWGTGYKTKGNDQVFGAEAAEIDKLSGDFTGEVYSNGGEWGWQEPTPKNLKIRALVREAEYFMEFRNHGYSNLTELNDYMAKYRKLYNQFVAENDDGTPVVPEEPVKPADDTKKSNGSSSHNSNHSSIVIVESDTTEEVDLIVTTIRQASLVTRDGKRVINRELVNDSTWHVEESAVINGQKMYRISENEWVSANDVK